MTSSIGLSKPSVRLLASIFFSGLLMLSASAWSADPAGKDLFEKRCVACHKLPDPGSPPTVGWEQQLDLMAPLARLEEEQKQNILDYLLSHTRNAAMSASLDEDRMLFEEKCSLCHTLDRIFLEPLEGEDLQHVISRMQNRSGTDWISDQELEKILAYLTQAPRTVPSTTLSDDASAEEIFAVRCSACHTLERVFGYLEASTNDEQFWSHTISRMRGKSPQWMSESEASQILAYLRTLGPEDEQ